MQETITTPDLTFQKKIIRKNSSQLLHKDNNLARSLAAPLFNQGVILAGIVERLDYSDGSSVPFARNYNSFMLLLEGRMHIENDREEFKMTPGDLASIPAGAPFHRSARGTPGRWVILQIEDTAAWAPLKEQGPSVRSYASAALMYLLMRQVLDARNSPSESNTIYIHSCAQQLVNMLRHEMATSSRKQSRHADALQDLINAIELSPEKPWSRKSMAEQLHVSVRLLTHIFNTEMGISPRRLVVRIRMNRAADMIASTGKPIKAIASELGYDSVHSFTRLFTRHVGTSPAAYRARFINPS